MSIATWTAAAAELNSARAGRLDEYQHDIASVLVADVLRQRGDSGGMRGIVSSLRARRECLVAPQGTSSALANAISAVRSKRCPEHNPLATLGAGIVFPGGGHYMHASTLTGVIATAAITSVFVSAYVADAGAKSDYAKYEASRIPAQTRRVSSAPTSAATHPRPSAHRAADQARARRSEWRPSELMAR